MATNPHHPTDATPPEGFNPQEPYQHCATCAYCTRRDRKSRKSTLMRTTYRCDLSGLRTNPQYPKCSLYRRRTP